MEIGKKSERVRRVRVCGFDFYSRIRLTRSDFIAFRLITNPEFETSKTDWSASVSACKHRDFQQCNGDCSPKTSESAEFFFALCAHNKLQSFIPNAGLLGVFKPIGKFLDAFFDFCGWIVA